MSMRMTVTNGAEKMWPHLLLLCTLLVPGSSYERKGLEPEFDVQLPNLTIKQGSDASFTCVVKHLGEYKVAWIRSEDKAIIAWHNHMVTHNHRFSVTHNGHNTWTLHIKNVQQNDSGSYMCQVNTDPQRSQYGTLDVVVPADIIDTETSNDVVVSEGQSAILKCKATGYPPPKVRWKRQDGQPLPISREFLSSPSEKIEVWEGERLALRPLQRVDTGPYLCIANNSVPPLVSKRVMVYVHFQPSIKVSNQLVAAPLGENVTIDCYVEAVPKPVISWFNKEGQLILNSVGKIWQETEIVKDYSLRTRLSISYLQLEDFTDYNCTAGNSLGAHHAIIKLKLLPPVTSKPTMTTTHVDVWRPMKHVNSNGMGTNSAGSNNNIKHKNHRRKSQRNRQGHRYDGEYGEGGGGFGGNGEDSSADLELFQTTSPSSSWSGNSRNYQRSAKEGSSSNSINSYSSTNNNNNRHSSNNNNNRFNGGGALDHPNLSSSAAAGAAFGSSRLINSKIPFEFPPTFNYHYNYNDVRSSHLLVVRRHFLDFFHLIVAPFLSPVFLSFVSCHLLLSLSL